MASFQDDVWRLLLVSQATPADSHQQLHYDFEKSFISENCPAMVHARRHTMGGGGGHGDFYYPKEVWSPTGGWWCDPKHWRRNTALALTGIALVCIPIAMKSISLEVRPRNR
jgi:hypothetical protein